MLSASSIVMGVVWSPGIGTVVFFCFFVLGPAVVVSDGVSASSARFGRRTAMTGEELDDSEGRDDIEEDGEEESGNG